MNREGLRPEEFADADARRRIAEDLDTTFFVEAAAGTGKTTELVKRILAMLLSGRARLDRIVAMTFTEKAAGEMKLRLREAIERQRAQSLTREEHENIERALQHLELARIGTIHSFCADVLRERPVEAGVDPLFEVAAEEASALLLDDVFDVWFQRALDDPPEGVRRVLRRRPRGRRQAGPRAALRSAVSSLINHRDFPHPWRRESFDRDGQIDVLLSNLEAVAALVAQAHRADDWLVKNLANLGRFLEENRVREAVRGRDHDALEAELRQLAHWSQAGWHWRGRGQWLGKDLPRAEVIEQRDAVKVELDAFLVAADADLAACLREELLPVVQAYEAAKHRSGRLDFLDLLARTRDLIRDNQDVRRQLQDRWQRFFVDEFQDTDPLQAEILLLLSADDPATSNYRDARPSPGKLFLVGDPKQSIYRFRRADVALYQRTKRRLSEQHGAEVLYLQTSFRSVPEIQEFVNMAFAPAMVESEDGSQPSYVALERYRRPLEGQPAVVVLPVPRPYSHYGKIVNYAIDESLPEAVGAYVDWLVRESGWQVADRDQPGKKVPVQPRHICLLFRRFQKFYEDVTRPYVRALESRRVPHVLVGGRSFHDRDEVLAIRNALNAIEWPDDTLRVFATLRGPFFALGDDALLVFRDRVGPLHPLYRIDAEKLAELSDGEREVYDALQILAGLHYQRNHRPIAETLTRFLEAVRAHAGIAIWPTGEQALGNCLRLVDRARRFERRGAPSFRAFVEQLEEEAERGGGEEAPVVEEGTEGVRIMTAHRAKGLEFPIVILADPTCNATRTPPSQYVDSDRGLFAESLCGAAPHELRDNEAVETRRESDEAIRVAYVAATRACDLLVVPAIGDEKADRGDDAKAWFEVLDPALFPTYRKRRQPAVAKGCPAFGPDSVEFRPDDAELDANSSVAPGEHVSELGNRVVWWDPSVLDLDREENIGLRQDRLLQADESGVVAEEGIESHQRWQEKRSEIRQQGAEPTIMVHTATRLAHKPDLQSEAGEVVEVHESHLSNRSDRPYGKRFGSLVHAVLAVVDLNAGESQLAKTVRSQARLFHAPQEEIEAAQQCVAAALKHDVLRRAARSAEQGGARRESPVFLKLAAGHLAEGIVDLAFREEHSDGAVWTVVDFKTDREVADQLPAYKRQVALYCDAVAKATGDQVRGVLLLV